MIPLVRATCVCVCVYVCVCARSLQSCLTLCDPMDCSQPGSFVHGILQERILKWLPRPPSRDLPDPGLEPVSLISPALAGRFFTTSAIGKPHSQSYSSAICLKSTFLLDILRVESTSHSYWYYK